MKSFCVRWWRLWAIGVPVVAAMAVMIASQYAELRDHLTRERTQQLARTVSAAYAQVDNFHQLVLNGDMTDADARQAALKVLREMRHSASEYFWVSDYRGRLLMHPIEPALEGQAMPTLDLNAERALQAQVVRVLQQQGSGYLSYQWPKPGSTTPVDKISYIRGFPPWGWGIASGVYVDDIDQALWIELRAMLQIFSILVCVLLVFWFGFHPVLFPRADTPVGKEREW